MGVMLLVKKGSTNVDIGIPVCGFTECKNIWIPTCADLGLEILPLCLQGGMLITAEYYDQLLNEVLVIRRAFEKLYPLVDDPSNICFRASRLLDLLREYPPSLVDELYLG